MTTAATTNRLYLAPLTAARPASPPSRSLLGAALISAATLLASVVGCSSGPAAAPAPDAPAPALVSVEMVTSKGAITLELDAAHAPISVANFLAYAERGAYDGTTFHRVIPTFVIQGGGYTPDLTERARLDAAAGRPDKPIANEWKNGLKNTRGTIAMARDSAPDTATREFYINVADNSKLDGPRPQTGNAGYAVFGRVVQGMDVVDLIKAVPTHTVPAADGREEMKDVPVEPVTIVSVRRLATQKSLAH